MTCRLDAKADGTRSDAFFSWSSLAQGTQKTTEEIKCSVLNVRDMSDQTWVASEETVAFSIELARLGTHLQMETLTQVVFHTIGSESYI